MPPLRGFILYRYFSAKFHATHMKSKNVIPNVIFNIKYYLLEIRKYNMKYLLVFHKKFIYWNAFIYLRVFYPIISNEGHKSPNYTISSQTQKTPTQNHETPQLYNLRRRTVKATFFEKCLARRSRYMFFFFLFRPLLEIVKYIKVFL